MTPGTIKERQERPERTRVVLPEATPASADLLAILKELRRELAKEMGKPAYVVFSDATLVDMAEKKPTTIYEFRLVNGVGADKAVQFGARFMGAVASWKIRN